MKQFFCWCLLVLAGTPLATQAQRALVVIDDLGYNLKAGLAVARLPFPATLAVIPFSPHAERIADVARAYGKDVIVHAPMASVDGRMTDPQGLYLNMERADFVATVQRQLAAVPHAIGLNNHMGSLLTQQDQPMDWLMQTLKQEDLYFIDSRTTALSVAQESASEHGVTNWRRNLFLDHYRDAQSIRSNVQAMLPMARDKGLVVAIGHPYDETINALADYWKQLEASGLYFVTPSDLIAEQLAATTDNPPHPLPNDTDIVTDTETNMAIDAMPTDPLSIDTMSLDAILE